MKSQEEQVLKSGVMLKSSSRESVKSSKQATQWSMSQGICVTLQMCTNSTSLKRKKTTERATMIGTTIEQTIVSNSEYLKFENLICV